MMNKPSIDHVGIATKSIEEATVFWDTLGLVTESDHVNHEQGVRIRMLEGLSLIHISAPTRRYAF